MRQFTLEDLKRILLAGAGAEEGVDLDADILDVEFDRLGYESLAILETTGRIEREFSIKVDEAALFDARTPRALIGLVNRQLEASVSA